MSTPFKRVVKRRFVAHKCARPGEGCTIHTLECLHEVVRKQSYGNPQRMRCGMCEREGRR